MRRRRVVGTPGSITQDFLEQSLHAERAAATQALGELAQAVSEMDRIVAEPVDERVRPGYHGAAALPVDRGREALERIRAEVLYDIEAQLQELLARPRAHDLQVS
jgi:hypothetical protein